MRFLFLKGGNTEGVSQEILYMLKSALNLYYILL
jgi:hypothetical protein